MDAFPTLRTERLILRQFLPSDAGDLQRLAGAKEVAAGTFLPHPYEDGVAERWIAGLQQDYDSGKAVHFAVVLAIDRALLGSIGLDIAAAHRHARIGYWLGVPYWNRGYGTEAVRAVLGYGFTALQLHRIYGPHFAGNAASGRVLQKAGMTYEGRLRGHYLRLGRFVDVELYGILEAEFTAR